MRAAIYCRISSDRDDTKLGVERQEQDCRQLCADEGWTIVGPYIDNDISAADPTKVRPEYRRLLKDIEGGMVDAVVVWAEDRLHRQPIELEEFVKTCDQAGVTKLVTVSGTIDMGTGDGMMIARIKGAVAAEEVRKMKQRVMRRKLQKAQNGEYAGGLRPYGFDADGVTHKLDEVELIHEAMRRALEGESLRSVSEDWNSRGLQTVRGKRWSPTMVKRLLVSPRMAGLRQHQGEIIGDGAWEPVIDRATWEQLCAVLLDPSRRKPPASRKYPLVGVLVCAECGSDMKAMPNGGRRRYGCKSETGGCGKTYVLADPIESVVYGTIVPLADSPALRDAALAEEESTAEEARSLVMENAADEKMLTQLEDDYADRTIDKKAYIRQSRRLQDRIEKRDGRLTAMRGQSALDRLGGHVAERWDEMSAEDRRMIVLAVVNQVTVGAQLVKGSNRFDPKRLGWSFRYEQLSKVASSGGLMGWPPKPFDLEEARRLLLG